MSSRDPRLCWRPPWSESRCYMMLTFCSALWTNESKRSWSERVAPSACWTFASFEELQEGADCKVRNKLDTFPIFPTPSSSSQCSISPCGCLLWCIAAAAGWPAAGRVFPWLILYADQTASNVGGRSAGAPHQPDSSCKQCRLITFNAAPAGLLVLARVVLLSRYTNTGLSLSR